MQAAVQRGRNHNTGAKRARETRAEMGLDDRSPVPCLLTKVEALGIHVVVGSLRGGVHGAYQQRNGLKVLFVEADMSGGRRRFTLAHELGHVRCGHEGRGDVDTFATLSGQRTTELEVQANAFASELLMPAEGVKAATADLGEPTLEDVVRLAAHFGTSALAMVIRLRTCERVSARRYERLRGEIDENVHLAVAEHLGCAWPDDRLHDPGELPYVSPALRATALGALLAGECTLDEAAGTAGVSPRALEDALVVLIRPA
jgi:Zn-dependent peptidase ImmA (M78 family)